MEVIGNAQRRSILVSLQGCLETPDQATETNMLIRFLWAPLLGVLRRQNGCHEPCLDCIAEQNSHAFNHARLTGGRAALSVLSSAPESESAQLSPSQTGVNRFHALSRGDGCDVGGQATEVWRRVKR